MAAVFPKKRALRLSGRGTGEAVGRALYRRGQALVESLLVILALLGCFCFFYDFAYGMVARLLLQNGSARAARAAAVGFNSFQREKALRVGLIPVSGWRLVPEGERGAVGELALVRTYLQSESGAEAQGILDYERWGGVGHQLDVRGNEVAVHASCQVPVLLPWKLGALAGWVPRGEAQRISADWAIEDHAGLYLRR